MARGWLRARIAAWSPSGRLEMARLSDLVTWPKARRRSLPWPGGAMRPTSAWPSVALTDRSRLCKWPDRRGLDPGACTVSGVERGAVLQIDDRLGVEGDPRQVDHIFG